MNATPRTSASRRYAQMVTAYSDTACGSSSFSLSKSTQSLRPADVVHGRMHAHEMRASWATYRHADPYACMLCPWAAVPTLPWVARMMGYCHSLTTAARLLSLRHRCSRLQLGRVQGLALTITIARQLRWHGGEGVRRCPGRWLFAPPWGGPALSPHSLPRSAARSWSPPCPVSSAGCTRTCIAVFRAANVSPPAHPCPMPPARTPCIGLDQAGQRLRSCATYPRSWWWWWWWWWWRRPRRTR
jgi:hypothetical protein